MMKKLIRTITAILSAITRNGRAITWGHEE